MIPLKLLKWTGGSLNKTKDYSYELKGKTLLNCVLVKMCLQAHFDV